MQTKLTLTIGSSTYELDDRSLKNWGDISCAWKRSDYSGVTRSFSSAFEFTEDAYETLLQAYLEDPLRTDVSVAVYVKGHDWRYRERFACQLDFSTVKVQDVTFSVNAVDNSLAALIKAGKGTKYEFAVGTDIESDASFLFDRLPMLESVTFGFTMGESEESGALTVTHPSGQANVWMGSLGSEVCVNGSVFWNDDQEDTDDGFMIKAVKPVEITLDSSVIVDRRGNGGQVVNYTAQHIHDGSIADSILIGTFGGASLSDRYVGTFASESALPQLSGTENVDRYAIVAGTVFEAKHKGGEVLIWYNTGMGEDEYAKAETHAARTFSLAQGDKIRIRAGSTGQGDAVFRVVSSAIRLSWHARGEAFEIAAVKPETLLNAILLRLADGKVNVSGRIEADDERIGRTCLLAAESIRGIEGAKLYSSFTEFCDWMETVFGYTYSLEEPMPSPITSAAIPRAAGIISTAYTTEECIATAVSADHVYYNTAYGKFVALDHQYYHCWPDSEQYNDPMTGHPYSDRLYLIDGRYYYFADGYEPIEYTGYPENARNDFQRVIFSHRSKLFNPDAEVKEIADAKEGVLTVNSAVLYSSVEIGYDKKDYEGVNGRDEFNFNSTYTTGCSLTDKKLTLMSKYRADSYGIEFVAQKRSASTTDSVSDQDVFFVLCQGSGRIMEADRSVSMEGTLSDAVFNAGFSPRHCVLANAGYIGMQADAVTLSFASSKGNSGISIDGAPLSADIVLDTPLMTACEVEFVTSDLNVPSPDCLVDATLGDVRYRGFIKEVSENVAREEAVKYKLFVKDMQSCI